MSECLIKVRMKGSRSYAFLTSKGGTNSLRVHAARFGDKPDRTGEEWARAAVEDMVEHNPGLEFKVVKA